ncbi:hypothetical protein Zm00014a_001890 [Zea mays]|uniref:Uncharacterized protein n=1 Tax=Zea mays TaxID=4577 RepID=A0A3L6FE17_MAIZE|nr:hypothetical protein Zm00014a_001890 [Zea mays]
MLILRAATAAILVVPPRSPSSPRPNAPPHLPSSAQPRIPHPRFPPRSPSIPTAAHGSPIDVDAHPPHSHNRDFRRPAALTFQPAAERSSAPSILRV